MMCTMCKLSDQKKKKNLASYPKLNHGFLWDLIIIKFCFVWVGMHRQMFVFVAVLPRGHAIPSTMIWFPMTGWPIACNHWHVATFWSWLRFQIPNTSILIVVAENHIPLFSSFSAIVPSLSQCDLIRLIWGVCYDNRHTWLCKLHSCINYTYAWHVISIHAYFIIIDVHVLVILCVCACACACGIVIK